MRNCIKLDKKLHKCKQYVELRNVRSSLEIVVRLVPQRSILGPLLFIKYINIRYVSNILKFVLFTDDTNIFTSNKDIVKQYCETNRELNTLYTWLCGAY